MTNPPVPEMLLTQEDTSDAASDKPTAGKLLKAARQAKGVHLGVLAMTLKVPVRQLEALEADQYDTFKGGPTFLRAITSAMCRHLGTDPTPVLALLPSAVSSMGATSSRLAPVSGRQRVSLRPARGVQRHARTVLGLALLMLLVTAGFLWLPSPESWWPGLASNEPAATASEESAVPLGQASNPESTDDAAPAASEAASAASGAAPAVPAVPAVGASAAQLSAQTLAPVAAASASAAKTVTTAAATPAVLRLDANADTWVEVRDAKGQPVGKLLKAGESMEIQQPVPYSVVIGRAQAVKATLRGQPFDLKPHTPQTVARFEVKE
jgi:cytoskeleton protein RodZ